MNAIRQIAMFLVVVSPLATLESVYSQQSQLGPSLSDTFHQDLNKSFGDFSKQQQHIDNMQHQVDEANINLARAIKNIPLEPITTPVQLYIAAPPSKGETVARLRQEAASELAWFTYHGWRVTCELLNTTADRLEASPATEDEVREMREHLGSYLDILKQIEALTGEGANAKADAQLRWEERRKYISVFPSGPYTVHTSDSTVITRYCPQYSPQNSSGDKPKGTHLEDRCGVEKCLVKAGFDKNNNPTFRWGYDVVRKKVEVPNN